MQQRLTFGALLGPRNAGSRWMPGGSGDLDHAGRRVVRERTEARPASVPERRTSGPRRARLFDVLASAFLPNNLQTTRPVTVWPYRCQPLSGSSQAEAPRPADRPDANTRPRLSGDRIGTARRSVTLQVGIHRLWRRRAVSGPELREPGSAKPGPREALTGAHPPDLPPQFARCSPSAASCVRVCSSSRCQYRAASRAMARSAEVMSIRTRSISDAVTGPWASVPGAGSCSGLRTVVLRGTGRLVTNYLSPRPPEAYPYLSARSELRATRFETRWRRITARSQRINERGERARQQGRGVRREHGPWLCVPGRLAPEGLLNRHCLGYGLADQVGIADGSREVRRVGEASEGVVDLVAGRAPVLGEVIRVLEVERLALRQPATPSRRARAERPGICSHGTSTRLARDESDVVAVGYSTTKVGAGTCLLPVVPPGSPVGGRLTAVATAS